MFDEEETGARILVVHDVEETRDGIEKLLRSSGYRVDPARDEKEAVWRALRQTPDLILVSLRGPETRVIASAQNVRESAGLSAKVPVVIFCVERLAEGTELQFATNVHMTRPDNFDDLRALLARLLRQPASGRSGSGSGQHRIVDHTRP
jgi:DNA-binding response OmpR family regulator